MRLATFLLIIQIGHTIAKSIADPRPCNDSTEQAPRLKGNYETEANTNSTHIKDSNNRKSFSEPINDNESHDTTDNKADNPTSFASTSNNLPENLPLVNNAVKFANNTEKESVAINKNLPIQEKVYFKTIDPKYIIVSRLAMSTNNKNVTNGTKREGNNLSLDDSNTAKVIDDSIGREAVHETPDKEALADTDSDITNIRELRKHLLDHLLDYFLNIIKDENYIRNDTRKNGNDNMKVEIKLRNYYDPHHLDFVFDDDGEEFDDNSLDDYSKNDDNEDDSLNEEWETKNIDNDGSVENTSVAYNPPGNLEKRTLNLEEELITNSPDNESEEELNNSSPADDSSPVTPEYINPYEKENDFDDTFLNSTKIYEDAVNDEINVVSTTERPIPDATLNDDEFTIDKYILDYPDEEVTDQIEYNINDGDTILIDNDSYEDYTDSDEFEAVKNETIATEHENEKTTEDGRRQQNATGTLNASNNKTHVLLSINETSNSNKNGTLFSKKELESNTSKILDILNKSVDDIAPCNDRQKISAKVSIDNQGGNEKFKNKISDKLVNKSSKLIKKRSCRKSIILNLNINLI